MAEKEKRTCPKCGGSGQGVPTRWINGEGKSEIIYNNCSRCGGAGEI